MSSIQNNHVHFENYNFNKSGEDYVIRGAEVEDFEKIVNIVNEAYWNLQKDFFIESPQSQKRIDIDELGKINQDPSQKLFVLFNKTQNAVSGVILFRLSKNSSNARFKLFALDESCRGKKLGSEMIAYVERCALKNGRNTMKIEVFTFAKRLAHYYQTLGYKFAGRDKTFIRKDCIREEWQNDTGLYLQRMVKSLKM